MNKIESFKEECNLLLHPGRTDAGMLEKCADFLLTHPRCVWLERQVFPTNIEGSMQLIPENNVNCWGYPIENFEEKVREERAGCRFKWIDPSAGAGYLIVSAISFVAQIPAGLCAAIGLPIKKLAIEYDGKAATFQVLVRRILRQQEILVLHKIILEELDNLETERNRLDQIISYISISKSKQLSINPEESESSKEKIPLKKETKLDNCLLQAYRIQRRLNYQYGLLLAELDETKKKARKIDRKIKSISKNL